MSDWQETKTGKFVYELDWGAMIVFERGSGWHGVYDGQFTVEEYATAEEAMDAMEHAVLGDREDLIAAPIRRPPPPSDWRRTKKGGWFRQYRGRQASVKQAKSGAWFVVNGLDLVQGRWFDSAEKAMRHADETIFGVGDVWG